MSEHITIDEVREWLDYDPATGALTWKKLRSGINRNHAGGYDGRGYGRIMFKRRRYMVTHVIWAWVYGVWPDQLIDHVNRDPHDNRIMNLRKATHQQNQINKNAFNRTGFKGVYKMNRNLAKPFYAIARVNGRNMNLGCFATVEEAAVVAQAKRYELYGEFAL